MRIAFVSHAYPRWPGDVAGAFVARLAAALARGGHAVTVLVPADRGQRGEQELDGVRVRRLAYAPAPLERLAHRGSMAREAATPWGAVAFVRLIRTLANALALDATEAVHAHWWIPGGVAAWQAMPRGAPAPVVTLHGTDARLLDRVPGARYLARRVLRAASTVTAVSSPLARRAASVAGVPAETIPVIPMPADLSTLPGAPSASGGELVTVSRLTSQKRVDVLLRAAAALATQGRAMPVTIVGDGPDRHRLERLAARLGLANVQFTGAVAPGDVPRYLAHAGVAAFPARAEGFGLAAAEALMCGVPVAAARDGGGLLDIVPNQGPGRVVDGSDPAAWAQAIVELRESRSARAEAWEAGQTWRVRLDPTLVAGQFERLYARA